MNDEITSDSDYDNPYTETALDWHHRSIHRLARRRCGLESSSSDESLNDLELNECSNADGEFGDIIFGRWVDSYPLIAARCSLFMQAQHGRRSVRDQEAKSLRRVFRKISGKGNEKSNDANVSSEEMKYHQLVANSILPKGLGISFVDAALSRSAAVKQPPVGGQQQKQKTFCQTVLEMNGPARSGMTSILIASAARYVANTSNIFIDTLDVSNPSINLKTAGRFTSPNTVINEFSPNSNKRQKVTPTLKATAEPRAVYLDLEHGVHATKLILSVRDAVLHRWEETSLARKWRRQQLDAPHTSDGTVDTSNCNYEGDAAQEHHQIERAIASCLGRIHVIQPRDFTYLSLVATIESLSKRLDDDRRLLDDAQQPPTLLIIDSISTLDACTRAQEGLPTVSGSAGGSGLSERNEFYRQLARLHDEHEVVIMGSSRRVHSNDGDSSGSIWDKMVSHRLGLHHVADGTDEQRKGYDFVATVKNVQGDASVFPYSVMNSGVHS